MRPGRSVAADGRRRPPGGPGPRLSGVRRPPRHRFFPRPGRGLLPHPRVHGAVPPPLPSRSGRLGAIGGRLAAAGRGSPGLAPALVVTAGFDPLRDDGVNYAAVLPTCRGRGRLPVLRRPGARVHGHGHPPDSLALATEVCDAMGRLMRRPASVGERADPRQPARGRVSRPTAASTVGRWTDPPAYWPWSAAASGARAARSTPSSWPRRDPTRCCAAHRRRLRAPRASVVRAGEWFAGLGGQVEGLMVLSRADAEDAGAAAVMRAGPVHLPGRRLADAPPERAEGLAGVGGAARGVATVGRWSSAPRRRPWC